LSWALYNYQEEYGCLPPPVVKDEHSIALHSWRVLLLPYFKSAHHLKNRQLDYQFDEPWNSPYNQQLADQNLDLYHLDWKPQKSPRRKSRLVAVIDDSTYWSDSPECHKLSDTDDLENHIFWLKSQATIQHGIYRLTSRWMNYSS
jgi:hypothetical protein